MKNIFKKIKYGVYLFIKTLIIVLLNSSVFSQQPQLYWIGTLGGSRSECRAISGDGSTVVGIVDPSGTGEPGEVAFIWDNVFGMRSLQDLLVNDLGLDLTGWTLRRAKGVSLDGQYIVGVGYNPDGNIEGWLANIGGDPVPEPTTILLLSSGIIGLAGFRRKFRKK